MKTFNINDYIYIQITETGWNHLRKTVGEDYIKYCIDRKPYRVEIEGDIWYRLQAHNVFDILALDGTDKLLYSPNIMFDDDSLK
jgi:hypothetical protein